MKENSKLSDKQQRFCEEYLKDFNATAAYLRAGYKCSEASARASASKLLTNPNIQEYIEAKKKENAAKVDLTPQWVLEQTLKVYHRCMQAEPVTDSEGNPTGEYRFSQAGANKALEHLFKYFGMFTDTRKIKINPEDLSKLSKDELEQRLAALEAATSGD